MNSQIIGLRVAGTMFGIICIPHLVRLVTGFQILIGGHEIPIWLNGVVLVISGVLCIWLWWLSYGSRE